MFKLEKYAYYDKQITPSQKHRENILHGTYSKSKGVATVDPLTWASWKRVYK